jgi:hypothetical protein
VALGAQFQPFLIEIEAPVLYPVRELYRKKHEYTSSAFLRVISVGTTELLAAVIRGPLLSGKHNVTRNSDSGSYLSSCHLQSGSRRTGGFFVACDGASDQLS